MVFEPCAIVVDAGEAEFPDAPVDAFAHLSADLAKPGPAHMQLRQGPLQEAHALLIFRGGMITTVRPAYDEFIRKI